MTDFQLTGPLPTSTVLLESSAGTGKTYTIAALAVRYIAEQGLDVGSMLMITFGVRASEELRSRVFTAIQETAERLEHRLRTGEKPDPRRFPVAHHLATTTDARTSLERLNRALDDFDSATIHTTHAFCNLALTRLGILGDADLAERHTQASTLIDEVGADCYLAMFSGKQVPELTVRQAQEIARSVCNSMLPLEPQGSVEVEYGQRVRDEFARRKRDMGVVTFDDLISRLRDVLRDDVTGPAACRWLCEEYAVVLVDEFQDTDPDQWAVIKEAFVGTDRPTILIGDPKQSIYGFRNADVLSYLDASESAEKRTLGTNYRSDPGIVAGVESLLRDLQMGDERIRVTPVKAHHGARLQMGLEERVHIRRLPKHDGVSPKETVIDDLVVQIGHALGRPITDPDDPERRVTLADITVLTRTGKTAQQVVERLNELGYPAVRFGGGEVWSSRAADDWRRFLRALLPSADAAKRVVALTDLVGATISEITATDAPTRIWDVLAHAAATLAEHGPGAALRLVREATGLDERLTPAPGGERYLTDLLHIGELLDETGHRDPIALIRELEERERLEDEADVRVTSDADAVKVMTLHSAKGLEFPVVLIPDLSETVFLGYKPFNLVQEGRRYLMLKKVDRKHRDPEEGPDYEELGMLQARDEELRLLYVGITRAKHLAIVWHTETDRAATGPLSAALFRDRTRPTLQAGYKWQLAPWLPHVWISEIDHEPAPSRLLPDDSPVVARPLRFTREIDQAWRRTSYTGLTTGLHDLPSGADETIDEIADPTALLPDGIDAPAPMGPLPAGAAFGTLVHDVLEHLDWSADGLHDRVAALVGASAVGFDDEQTAMLVAGIEDIVRTPLLPLTGQSLSEIPISRRLPELDFDLPMADSGGATLGQLAELLATHQPADDPLASYPARLANSPAAAAHLRGMLTGSIDAVLQTQEEQFLVVDYKTNRLAPTAEDVLTLGHYAPRPMAQAMMAAHYPLQAILYCAALHRYLTLRLPGYSPETHLGGVGYLFVRGMAGESTPVVDGHSTGVFAWHPSAELVVAVSELLGGRHA